MTTELHVTLTMEELEFLALGEVLTIEQPDLGKRLVLKADTNAVIAFKQHVQAAILNLLPVNPSKH